MTATTSGTKTMLMPETKADANIEETSVMAATTKYALSNPSALASGIAAGTEKETIIEADTVKPTEMTIYEKAVTQEWTAKLKRAYKEIKPEHLLAVLLSLTPKDKTVRRVQVIRNFLGSGNKSNGLSSKTCVAINRQSEVPNLNLPKSIRGPMLGKVNPKKAKKDPLLVTAEKKIDKAIQLLGKVDGENKQLKVTVKKLTDKLEMTTDKLLGAYNDICSVLEDFEITLGFVKSQFDIVDFEGDRNGVTLSDIQRLQFSGRVIATELKRNRDISRHALAYLEKSKKESCV